MIEPFQNNYKKRKDGKKKITSKDNIQENKQKLKKTSDLRLTQNQLFNNQPYLISMSSFGTTEKIQPFNYDFKKKNRYSQIVEEEKNTTDYLSNQLLEKKEEFDNVIKETDSLDAAKIMGFVEEVSFCMDVESKNIRQKEKDLKISYDNLLKLQKELIELKSVLKKEEEESKNYVIKEDFVLPKSEKYLELEKQNIEENNKISSAIEQKDILSKDIITKNEELIKIKNEIDFYNNESQKNYELKNKAREDYLSSYQIVLNDNKFCLDNFCNCLTLFPYLKHVAFIPHKTEKDINDPEIKTPIDDLFEDENDQNKMNIDKTENEIDEENIQRIKLLINPNNIKEKLLYTILSDRKILLINNNEKYKFKKIFSDVNNKYKYEFWTQKKYDSFKTRTINAYFNDFNNSGINSNYFIVYLVPKLNKETLNSNLYNLYKNLLNNEFNETHISTKISIITESQYINLQNINQESKVKNQLSSMVKGNLYNIYGFLFEFTKTNRLNKKNYFRIYNFDYSYPQIIDVMSNLYKHYVKKKPKKTGLYKKGCLRPGDKDKQKQKKRAQVNVNNNNQNTFKAKIINTGNNNLINKKNLIMNKKIHNGNNNLVIKNVKITGGNQNFKKINNNIGKTNNLKTSNSFIGSKKNIDDISRNKEEPKSVKKEQINEKSKSMTPNKYQSEKSKKIKKIDVINLVMNDLKIYKPEHTLVIHDINFDFVLDKNFKLVAKASGLLIEK